LKDTLSFLVQSLLQKNNIKVANEELDFQIQSHPSYPSLHAITGVLSHFEIDNAAIRVPVDTDTLKQLPTSFIGQIKTDDDTDFALIVSKGAKYKIIASDKKSTIISEAIFLERFTGILVAVEKDEIKNTKQTNTADFQKPLVGAALVLFTLLFFKYSPSLAAAIYFALSSVGLIISLLIIQHDLGLRSKIIDRVCAQESKTTNCNAVLNSKGATLYKKIKLSDASLVYFISIAIASLLLSISNATLNALHIISLTALPVVIYSIYYQIKVSKNWCMLCLGIASVLVLQASFFFFTNAAFTGLKMETILLISFSFSISASGWLFISSRLKEEQAYKKLKIEATKFKRNFHLFNTLLQQSETVDTTLINAPEIVLGNTNAPLKITIITNPFCGHCKSVHTMVESILRTYHNDLSITIRFNINPNDLEDKGVLVATRLLELFHTESELICLEAIHDIYTNRDAKSWLIKWEKSTYTDIYASILEAEYNWCLANNINFTPEILINGKSYPKAYERSDLPYFIEELNEACFANMQTTQLQETL